MQNSELTKQGGSVVTFIVVGVVLAIVVVGGVYMVQKRSQDSAKPAPVAVKSNTATPSPTKSPVKSPTTTPKVTPKASTAPSPVVSPSRPPMPSPTVTAKPVPSTKVAPNTDKLPVTGPEDTIVNAAILAILAGSVVAYLRSFRVRYGFQAE